MDIDVSEAVYDRARADRPIEITTARGLLGWEYLVAVRVPAADD